MSCYFSLGLMIFLAFSIQIVTPLKSPILSLIRKLATTSTLSYLSIKNSLMPLQTSPRTKLTTNEISTSTTRKQSQQMISAIAHQSKPVGSSFVRDAVKTVGPSVVRIDCEKEIPPMLAMFNDNFKEGETVKISGTGIVVSSDGYLLTNAHVVDGSKRIIITLASGRAYKASLVSSDELTDLAVLKADLGGDVLSKAPIGDSSALVSGDWVIAVGCPVGLDFTVTLGVVSNPKRSAAEVGAPHMRGNFIQTDAALNSGNSGGPLVNEDGQVIGINTMVRTNTEAIGFSIPINRARQIYEVLKQGKKPTHAYFGVEIISITPDFARIHNDDPNANRLPERLFGAMVTRITPNSPAAIGGFRKNDVIVEVNGTPVNGIDDSDTFLDVCVPGKPAIIKVARGESGAIVILNVIPEDLLQILQAKRNRQMPVVMMRP